MSNLIPDAPPLQTGILTESPPDAGSYEQICLRPLPPNTSLDYRVRVDDNTVDFYFHYDPLPGAQQGSRKWVCRTKVGSINPNDPANATAGEVLYDVQQIDTSQYDAQASSACQDTSNAGYLTKLACGENPDLPSGAKWIIYGIAAIIGLILLVWVVTITSKI